MLIKTKCFGEVDIQEDKIVTFDLGLMGFENYKRYTLIYNNERNTSMSWLQSIDEPSLAMPVISPYAVKTDYNPKVSDDIVGSLGELDEENLIILVTMRVPEDITKMTVNLKAPLLVNASTRQGVQDIVDNLDYPIKYEIYDIVRQKKEGA